MEKGGSCGNTLDYGTVLSKEEGTIK